MQETQSWVLPRQAPIARYIVGVAVSLVVGLAVGFFLLRPPLADLAQLALLLGATAALSLSVGFIAYRWSWIERTPRLAYALLGTYVLATALTILNVWVSAQLMFLSTHDLMLGATLLIFAGGIAVALGAFFSDALTERLEHLRGFAESVALGRLDARVAVSGKDEVADLARSLNEMAAQLEDARRRQQATDARRRQLLAWLGHDLRTPLSSVQAIVEALADGMVNDPTAAETYLRTAQRNIKALAGLIDDLFQVAQIEAGELELHMRPNSMSDLVSDAIESFSAVALEGGVHLSGAVEKGIDPVTMDAPRVARVLHNIVSNALRHTGHGGEVRIRAERHSDQVCVTVSDTGEGIPVERLSEVENRRPPLEHRTGLGLAIARGFVDAHGGELAIDSTLGEGTAVRFWLPVA